MKISSCYYYGYRIGEYLQKNSREIPLLGDICLMSQTKKFTYVYYRISYKR